MRNRILYIILFHAVAAQVMAQQIVNFSRLTNYDTTNRTGNFPPPVIAPVVYAIEAKENIIVDGKLNEKIWQEAIVVHDFFRIEPRQGGTFRYPTFVKIAYDKKNLYFGVFCKDSVGKKGIRVQDYRRDFDFGNNDNFYIALDPQNLKRYCAVFNATPLGTQRDVQVYDDSFRDIDWDALWKVRTSFTDSGYYQEYAIPFSTLRYNKVKKSDSVVWRVSFSRFARRDYEQTSFPAVPQTVTPQRMTYAAELKGLKLPPPSVNLRVYPYTLFQHSQITNGSGVKTINNDFKAGGEIKWAVSTHAVLDLTFNTDFAQADVDRAVNNLTRFNVFFPEKRQFFLENNGVYAGAGNNDIKPFFSRTIGLANTQFNASPVPIDAGVRYTDRTVKRAWAGLYVRQSETETQPAANFGVLRFLKNYGKQNNVGVMVTHRLDESDEPKGFEQRNNSTVTFDGLFRPKDESWTVQYLVSASRDNTNDSIGFAGSLFVTRSLPKWYYFWITRYVDDKYVPGMGFVFANKTVYHNPGGYFIWRPKGKLGKIIRRWDPGMYVNYYHNADNGKLQQADIYLFPVYIILQSGGFIQYAVFPTWQNIDFNFSVLGMPVEQKQYYYTRHQFDYYTDRSRKISFTGNYSFGNYYNGKLRSLTAGIRIAPVPHAAFTFDYSLNDFKNFGINREDKQTHLYTGGLRLAYNPRIQASLFYQYNSYDKQGRWNIRGSWEFAPLSFFYVVFNDNRFLDSPARNQSVISKISYLKQF